MSKPASTMVIVGQHFMVIMATQEMQPVANGGRVPDDFWTRFSPPGR